MIDPQLDSNLLIRLQKGEQPFVDYATGDLQLFKRAKDLGLDADFIGSGPAATRARDYVPQPVQIAPEATQP